MKNQHIIRKSILLSLSAILCAGCVWAMGCGSDTSIEPESEQTDTQPTVVISGSSAPSVCAADVNEGMANSVEITSWSDYVSVGATISFAATSESSDQTILWSSSDDSVATVDQSGVVTGIGQGQVLITASTADGTAFDSRILRVAKSGLIFLSPSRQDWNDYAAGDTNECEQAFGIAEFVQEILVGYGCEVHICPVGPTLTYRARIAYDMNAICYVAIHTNAGNEEYTGTTALFHPDDPDSIALSLALFEQVAALTPTEETHGPYNGMNKDGVGYAEIREPNEFDIPTTLLEVEYHDKADTAQWIIDHHPEIAEAIADGIMNFLSTR